MRNHSEADCGCGGGGGCNCGCECGCGGTCSTCRGVLEHPRYYAGQVITASDLVLEHDYLHDKFRRHNRMLHGWGVVCGAKLQCVCDRKTGGYNAWQGLGPPGAQV